MRILMISAAVLAGCLRLSGAYAEPLLVSHSDNKTYQSVQEAIDTLPMQGGDILIAPGTYCEKVKVVKPGVHIGAPAGSRMT
ncbi:hypothetical protein [Bradyrhizobium sp. SRL28]|uniref:hypothetical protein n=1 Tax=Bradyrhizobium sp. SRL28 TaxID=2836178 RepID=UPI00201BD8F6|nr:hypothetical protein [Bradyrhizobium sp. SRL28]